MADPFLETSSPLHLEVVRLAQENRELRQENATLRARVEVVLKASANDSDAPSGRASVRNAISPVAAPALSSPGSPSGSKSRGGTSLAHSTLHSAAAPVASEGSHGAAEKQTVSTARLQEAVQRVKSELQGEVEKYRRDAEAKASKMQQLTQQFELFVATTCEREAGYELVYNGIFHDLEEQQALVRSAQALLEEQRQEIVQLRHSLNAAAVSAPSPSATKASPTAKTKVSSTSSAQLKAPPMKKRRSGKPNEAIEEPAHLPLASPQAVPHADVQNTIDNELTGRAVSVSVAESSTEPRRLKIVQGGAALRNGGVSRRSKRTRDTTAHGASIVTHPTGGERTTSSGSLGLQSSTSVFASLARHIPRSSSIITAPSAERSAAASPTAVGAFSSTNSPATNSTIESLWPLLAQYTETAHNSLPLWQHLSRLRGEHRLAALTDLISLLLHMLSGADAAAAQFVPPAALPPSFTALPSSVAVVATTIRLLAVQQEMTIHQHLRGTSSTPIDVITQKSAAALRSLFYRVCVTTLRRWQTTEAGGDAIEQWSTTIAHLYGFQPELLKLMQYTNLTALYQRTRLPRSWITYTVQAIFSQCFITSLSSSSAALLSTATSSIEAATDRWRQLCDNIGWSPHALPLDRLEAAAARCVARTRVRRSSFTPQCAEEALLSLRLVVLFRGFDHMENIAKLLEQPGVLPMAVTKEIYAELVSLAVMDRVPFRSGDAFSHALRLLTEYVEEIAPERCTSAEHFVSVPRLSHLVAALALVRSSSLELPVGDVGKTETNDAVQAGRHAALRWLQAQQVALDMVHQSRALSKERPLLLRDTLLGQSLFSELSSATPFSMYKPQMRDSAKAG